MTWLHEMTQKCFPAPCWIGQEIIISEKWVGMQKFGSELYKTLQHKGSVWESGICLMNKDGPETSSLASEYICVF